MSVPLGSRLGSYEVLAKLGEGGMGEVYRARDTKLNRDVALKVLPASFAADADRVARFKREAHVLASLNHPNIAQIYGIEDSSSSGPGVPGSPATPALVMELVEGRDLSEMIGGLETQAALRTVGAPALHLGDSLAIARQIAEALEAAHELGIVHRDLKPQNVKVRADGTVKVLDFGLASIQDPGTTGPQDSSNSPTLTGRATQIGMILGTAAYMSPEQARGKAVDRRADIWAFGVVLYEMLTGKRVFEGEEVSDVLAAVLRQEVDFAALPADVPPAIRRLLTRCLTRDPKQRLADASTIRLEIDEALKAPASAQVLAASQPSRTSLPLLIACGVLALMTIALAAFHFSEAPPASPPEMRLDIVTGPTEWGSDFEVSPDGLSIVFVAPGVKPGVSQLWLRRLDRADALMLAGTEGGRWPFWSPDSRSIGFFGGGSVLRIDATGGTATELGKTDQPFGGTWNADGVILFRSNRGLFRVAATGGSTTTVIAGVAGMAPRFPQFLPDGRHFLYYIYTAGGVRTGLYLASLDDPTPTQLGTGESTARFIAPNLLLFVEQGRLVARALDLNQRQFIGDAQTLTGSMGATAGHGAFSVSSGGLVAYRPQAGDWTSRLSWVDRTGAPSGAPIEVAGSVHDVEISPDGTRLAVDRTLNQNRDISVSDLALNGMTRLTFDAGIDGFPAWSRDSATIAFEINRTGDFDIHARASSGAGEEQVWLKHPGHQWPIEFSIDSKLLLYYDSANDGDLMALPLSGSDRAPIPIARTPATESQAVLSPDGRWVAYSTSGLEGGGVVVQAFPVANGQWQVSAGGHSPRWSAKGHELYFVSGDTLMAATVRPSPTAFAFDPPVTLFPVRLAGRNARSAYLVDHKGRFLLNLAAEATVSTPINVLLNWRGGAIAITNNQ